MAATGPSFARITPVLFIVPDGSGFGWRPECRLGRVPPAGAGKSYLVKLELLRSLYRGIHAHVIDPER